jgi:hypothetical protein
MILRRITEHVKTQNWFAVVLDFLIVVFGIFIGFQVTQWNEARIDRLQERSYLERLHTDINQSIERNEWNAAFMNHQADYGSVILQALDTCKLEPSDEDSFASGLFLAGKITHTVLFSKTIDELNSTGKFKILRNTKLKGRISALVGAVEFRKRIDERIFAGTSPTIATIEDRVSFFQSKPTAPIEDITASGVRYNVAELCSDTSFKNAISAVRASTLSIVYFV